LPLPCLSEVLPFSVGTAVLLSSSSIPFKGCAHSTGAASPAHSQVVAFDLLLFFHVFLGISPWMTTR
jgi:hypothetical protein